MCTYSLKTCTIWSIGILPKFLTLWTHSNGKIAVFTKALLLSTSLISPLLFKSCTVLPKGAHIESIFEFLHVFKSVSIYRNCLCHGNTSKPELNWPVWTIYASMSLLQLTLMLSMLKGENPAGQVRQKWFLSSQQSWDKWYHRNRRLPSAVRWRPTVRPVIQDNNNLIIMMEDDYWIDTKLILISLTFINNNTSYKCNRKLYSIPHPIITFWSYGWLEVKIHL